MIVIPAIDIYQDKVVRLSKGDFENVTYYKNTPAKQAKVFEEFGFQLIHVVDLLGSKTGKFTAIDSVKEIKKQTNLKVEYGGGIRDAKSLVELFNSGIDYSIIGSLSIKNKNEFELIVKQFTPSKIIAAVDVKNEEVFVSGWTESTSVSVFEHIEFCRSLGIEYFICTDISKDGMLTGSNLDLYKKILDKYDGIKLIASGGVKDIQDIEKLNEINPYAVVVGKAIYENKIDLKELVRFAK